MADLLDLQAIATHLGLSYETVRSYHTKAEANRRAGRPKVGDFPPPDNMFGRSPVWQDTTIDQWAAHRPGRGAGGGRPRKQP
ncbi:MULTISPECIES: hypothetical protein [Streptomyces]|uniref:MarR family transcriptional regulator n=1 Tax=Streptomyces dengpaensis TaxID=2049881 RepID=A0ABM6SZ79_9ACTN|nr:MULTISPECIES: hypothetical protein [Streptomyces]AVH59948.1 hypothetical protein C4B68_33905 [Streptomyces dengpaensis]PIB09583.1 hypothetical protein B1C81_10580 [Streptomyces sp. HG99]